MPALDTKGRTKSGQGSRRTKEQAEPENIETFPQEPSIDFPVEHESVKEGVYTIRISAEPYSELEISINNGDWLPCRFSVGYWWFDWIAVEPLVCKLVARSRIDGGPWTESSPRTCEITNSHEPLHVGLTL